MGIFDKKYCDICGEKISLLGNKKLENGNMCKDCADKLSPFFSERKNSTIEEIKEQLKYREENAALIRTLNPDKVFGRGRKVYVDTPNSKFFVTRASNWKDDNPDVIDFSQLIACNIEVVEESEELFETDKDGNEKSYSPRKFEYTYKFVAVLTVNSPWFDEIEIELSDGDYPDTKFDEKYYSYEKELYELKSTLTGIEEAPPQQTIREGIQQVFTHILNATTVSTVQNTWKCTCGAENEGNFCTNCGSKKPVSGVLEFRCSKCGWVPQEGSAPPKFCPQCGDQFDMSDIAN